MTGPRVPLPVYVLAFAVFAQGTSELMLSGLLPGVAADLRVSVAAAGLLASGFAAGMAVGAPLLTAATLRWPYRRALLAFLSAFVLAHLFCAAAPGYGALMAGRVLGAVAYAGFWVSAMVAAVRVVPAEIKGRALAVVSSGLAVATIVGVPLSTVVGDAFSWRTAMLAVAGATALAAVGIVVFLPEGRGTGAERPDLRRELAVFTDPRLWLTYLAAALSAAQGTAIATYLGALLIGAADLRPGRVPVALVIAGVGALLGLAAGGRFADRWPFATLLAGFSGAAAASVLLVLGAGRPVTAVLCATALQFFGWSLNPAVNVRVFTYAAAAPSLAGAANITGFNIGIMAGPALGGLLIALGGLPAVGWASAGFALAGLAAAGGSYLLRGEEAEPAQATLPVAR
ncbi:MFS transporter [Actinomadura graeca]|uniref:MFS transporter n=1 Tax=Actinomadura graeca TaxID=2750812 RepID=A0ABX8QSY5_9ACTN|nr:MFS transporter [Actinomadura graeca]QXJ19913.1 MFS transporter [Actinomadura graeca]